MVGGIPFKFLAEYGLFGFIMEFWKAIFAFQYWGSMVLFTIPSSQPVTKCSPGRLYVLLQLTLTLVYGQLAQTMCQYHLIDDRLSLNILLHTIAIKT